MTNITEVKATYEDRMKLREYRRKNPYRRHIRISRTIFAYLKDNRYGGNWIFYIRNSQQPYRGDL